MKPKTHQKLGALQVLKEIAPTQFKDVQHAGTPRDGEQGGYYHFRGVEVIRYPHTYTTLADVVDVYFDIYLMPGNNIVAWANVAGINAAVGGLTEWGFRVGSTGALVFAVAFNGGTTQAQLTANVDRTRWYHLRGWYGADRRAHIMDLDTGEQVDALQTAADNTFAFTGTHLELGRATTNPPLNWQSRESGVFGLITSDRQFFITGEENEGDVSFNSYPRTNGNGVIMDAITVEFSKNENSIHRKQNVHSFINLVGYSARKFYDLRGEGYYADDAPPIYLHQISQFALQNGTGVLFTSRVRKQIPGLGAGAIWGVDYIPPTVATGQTILTPQPDGIYLANDSFGTSGMAISKRSVDPNFPNSRFEFDGEFFGGQMDLTVRNGRELLNAMNTKVNEIVASEGLTNNRSDFVFNWYMNVATQQQRDELDATIPNDVDGSVVTYERFYNDLQGGHRANSISNITAEAIVYIHPTPITGRFTLLQGQIVKNRISHLGTLYNGLPFSIEAISLNYNHLGDFNNYMLLRDARLFDVRNIRVPRNELVQLPPFMDATDGLLDNIGHCQNNVDKISPCFIGNNMGQYKLLNDNFATLANFEFSFWLVPLSADGTALNIVPVSKYNFISTSSFQVQRTASNGAIHIFIADSANTFVAVNIIPNESIINNVGALLKGTVRVYGNTVVGLFNDIITDTGTLVGGMRLVDVPFVIGGTNQGASKQTNNWQTLGFELKELNASGEFVRDLSRITFNEPIIDATNHFSFDKTGNGNNATLMDGLPINQGMQRLMHDLNTNGFSGSKKDKFVFDFTNIQQAVNDGDITIETSTGSGHQISYDANGNLILSATSTGVFILRFPNNRMYYLQYNGYLEVEQPNVIAFVRWINGQIRSDAYPTKGRPTASDGRPSATIPGTNLNNTLFLAFFNNDTQYKITRIALQYTGEIIPSHLTNPLLDATNNILQVTQPGDCYLDCGTQLIQRQIPELIQADRNVSNLFTGNITVRQGNPIFHADGRVELNAGDQITLNVPEGFNNVMEIDGEQFGRVDYTGASLQVAFSRRVFRIYNNAAASQAGNFFDIRATGRVIFYSFRYFFTPISQWFDINENPIAINFNASELSDDLFNNPTLVDSNGDGVADGLLISTTIDTVTIIDGTANGFSGNIQRVVILNSSAGGRNWFRLAEQLEGGRNYRVRLKYRSEQTFFVQRQTSNGYLNGPGIRNTYPINTGQAAQIEVDFFYNADTGQLPFQFGVSENGQNLFFEVGDIELYRILDGEASLVGVFQNRIFADVSQKDQGIIKNIRTHETPLVRRQLAIERQITNN